MKSLSYFSGIRLWKPRNYLNKNPSFPFLISKRSEIGDTPNTLNKNMSFPFPIWDFGNWVFCFRNQKSEMDKELNGSSLGHCQI